MRSSAERVVQRPPRHAILAERESDYGRLGRKDVPAAEANRRMDRLVDGIANGVAPIGQEEAEIVGKVLSREWRRMNRG